ncbi:translocation and assembly module TamA [Bradyrhizobium sp. USDA 4524]|uniref:autotransporter assembly complex protein TamA n=1 Tax=unclassified Bradyrhizobium TaxID=2631580 RepID=UPI00209EEF48|nr:MULTISPECIES: BamA/TamA family outer membrane protein [unclassified Bradyrhizobium]MCP1845988.1 translocation and assembly module TamA [Bradyrhizobium sp. USDA 4538]MCP1907378.1 translocation and assembly module TamA [Bradyrhizobium sp. USDA 4537]MCP1985164.1 translocation and assembly module TamA [Bradyrhizobium sp. USDA 4539]
MRIGFAVAAIVSCSLSGSAHAFDFFGLLGSDDPPPVSTTTLSYRLVIEARTEDGKEDSDAEQALRDASATYRLRQEPPPDGDGLARRLQADINPLLDTLWGLGRYNAEVDVAIDGVPVSPLDEAGFAAAADRADALRNKAVVPIKVTARLGRLFKLRTIDVDYPHDQTPQGLPRRAFGLKPGDPAVSADLRTAQLKLVDWFRSSGHPLAKIADVKATVDHAAGAMDLRMRVEPGPKAGIGAVTISGDGAVDPRVVATHVYLKEGEPYSPERLALTKTSIAKMPAIGGIRIREADKLDANGNLPVFIDVTDRPRHAVGLSAKYSTVDGPGISGYYEDRNIFGGGERLRLEASASLLQRVDGTSFNGFSNLHASDFGARFTGTFIKPGLFGTPNDLLIEATAFRERVGNNELGGYTDDTVRGTIGVVHRFSETASLQGGFQVEQSKSQDVLGRVDATLVGFTATGRYDTTDNPLDPTRGVRLAATVNAYPKLMGSTIDLFEGRVSASAYYALDEQADYVLAGRLAAGSLAGAPLADIPDSHRFFAGGGGSVRGYGFNTISPMMFGQITGGSSLIEGSAEVRVRITPTIGLVPFLDFGSVSHSSLPGFSDYVGYGAGLGLRYLTPVGPIRLDVATPLNPRPGDSRYAIYVSIGQAF